VKGLAYSPGAEAIQFRLYVTHQQGSSAIVTTNWLDLVASEHTRKLRPIQTARAHVIIQPPLSLQRAEQGIKFFDYYLIAVPGKATPHVNDDAAAGNS
jgi:hypothetical protein